MFVLDDGQPLTEAVYQEVWKRARAAVLETHEIATPLGRNVIALRDACIAAWLRDGDQSAQHILAVAECADISAPRLVERFSHCLRKPKPSEIPWGRLAAALRLPTPQHESMAATNR